MTNSQIFSLTTAGNIVLLSIAYYIAGLVGIEMQSAQTGISPFWPASGITLAAFIVYGIRLWPGIYIAMGMLAFYLGIPFWVAMLSATGSVLEIAVPLYIVQKYGFKGTLANLRQLLLFLSIICTGPVISATIGSLSFTLSGMDLKIPMENMFFTWWLGNSFGMILVGSAIILLLQHFKQQLFVFQKQSITLLITVLAAAISITAFQDMDGLHSALILNLMIPLVILSSIFIGYAGTLIPVFIASLTMVTMSSTFPESATYQYPLGIIFLDILELWIITLTGLLVNIANKERVLHMKENWLSTHDGLTSLRNRRAFELELEALCSGLRQKDKQFCLLFLDLNDFKQVNDTSGHLAGDAGLAHVGKILQKSTRVLDTVARWGGDEFTILLPDCSVDTAMKVAKSINQKLKDAPFNYENQQFTLSFSIGIAQAKENDGPNQIIERADKACFQSKHENDNISLAEITE